MKKNLKGKINVGAKNSVNKYQFAKKILRKFNIKRDVEKNLITNFSVVKRKLDTRLDLTKLKKNFKKKKIGFYR